MRITSKGQVTIPKAIREKAGLLPETEVEFGIDGGRVIISRIQGRPGKSRGDRIVDQLRRHPGDIDMTTDEILALMRGE